MAGDPYAIDSFVKLPLPSESAPKAAAELYLMTAKRPIMEIRMGDTLIGYYRLMSLETRITGSGYPELVGTYQQVLL